MRQDTFDSKVTAAESKIRTFFYYCSEYKISNDPYYKQLETESMMLLNLLYSLKDYDLTYAFFTDDEINYLFEMIENIVHISWGEVVNDNLSQVVPERTGIEWEYALVRNNQLDNRLSIADSAMLAISTKNGQVLTINNLPDYSKFDGNNWIAMLCDSDKTNTVDPIVSGDYLHHYPCTINRANKTLTFAANKDLTAWEVGDNLVLYNAFLNHVFPGSNVNAGPISVVGIPAWRSPTETGGPMFKHSDGRYIWLILGYGVSGNLSLGYATSLDCKTWVMGNNDNFVFQPTVVEACTGGGIGGGCGKLPDGRYYAMMWYDRASDGQKVHRILYFNEDLTVFTYSSAITLDGGYSFLGGNIIKIGNYYHYVCASPYLPQSKPDIYLTFAKSLSLEGPYITYQQLVNGTNSNDGTAYSYDINQPSIHFDGVNVFCLFGAEARWSPSGNKGNREFCLATFDPATGLWSEDRRGAVVWNPLYYSAMGLGYAWTYDHCGGFPSIFYDGDDVYMTFTLKGSVYKAAIMKLHRV